MEKDFQTSFIPQKPLTEERIVKERPVGVLNLIGIIIFIAALISAGGVYLYESYLVKKVDSQKASFAIAQEQFQPSLISDLQILDKRIGAAQEILDNHVTVTPILKTLQDLTLKNIRYSKFGYAVDNVTKKIQVKLSGQATGYVPIALQTQIFSDKNKSIQDPIFSNLTLEEKTGYISFDLTFNVDPVFVSYKNVLAGNAGDISNNQSVN